MDIKRVWRHIAMTHRRVNRAFAPATLRAIEQAIKESESAHRGEVRFVVEGALDGAPVFDGQSARERALHLFSVRGVDAVTRQVVGHFPARAHNSNELPDRPLVL